MEGSCLARPGNPYRNNCKLQLATNEITATFKHHPLTPIGSLTPMSHAIHDYINRENDMLSHITTLMMEMKSVPKTLDFTNLLTWLSASENLTEFCHCERFKTYNCTKMFELSMYCTI
jgi:hypothetical protein